MLKRSLGLYPHPYRGIHCHCSTKKYSNSENEAAGKGYRPRISQGWLISGGLGPEGQSMGYDITSLKTIPCHIGETFFQQSDKFAGHVGEGLYLHSVGL